MPATEEGQRMKWIAGIGRELIGLIIDDGSLAAATVLWIALCGLLFAAGVVPEGWRGLVLGLGLAVILGENAWRGAGCARR
jgi:hypothetical protein